MVPLLSSSQDKPEPGRRAGTEVGVATAFNVTSLCQQGRLFYTVLKLCTARRIWLWGDEFMISLSNLGTSRMQLGNHILCMYAYGGRLKEAMDVFTRVRKPDVCMWFSIISAHSKHGKPKEAIQLYREMRRSGVKADGYVFVATLQACGFAADLESVRNVHSGVLHSGNPTDVFVGNCLVDLYAKCGELKDARQVIDSMDTKDVVTWNALIGGYAQQGLGLEALVVYGQMEEVSLDLANHVTFACLLKACGSTGALQKGWELPSKIVKRGLLNDVVVGTCLVDMYAKCGELGDARQIFDGMNTKNVVTWNALIAGYAQQRLGQEALVVYEKQMEEGLILADHVTFACLLKACASTGAIQKGRELHSKIVKRGLLDDVFVGNCLVDMYAKMWGAGRCTPDFDSMNTKNVVTWNTLVAGHA